MDQNEYQPKNKVMIDKDAQINVVVNRSSEDAAISMGRVFHNMKVKRRVFAWVLVLCLVLGICAPLLLYQFNRPFLTVSSVVTLKYEVPMVDVDGVIIPLAEYTGSDEPIIVWQPVKDLTAPDGSELDLNAITSSYVLQQALNALDLSQAITLSALRRNISIEKVLSEKSRQAQELASKMTEDKSAEAYEQMQTMEIEYDNRFVVRLTNGFRDEDSKVKVEITDAELNALLDRILSAYNDYLVETYADVKIPNNLVAEIKTDELDLLESLDIFQTASDELYDYCNGQRNSVKVYRSSRDGRNLEDWMEAIQTNREVSIDNLYSFVYTNSIVKNPTEMLTTYENKQRDNERSKQEVNDKIEADVKTKTENYKKPTVIVSMQESGAIKSTQKTPDSFNELILRLAKNYDKIVELEITADDLSNKIASLNKLSGSSASQENVDKATSELENAKITFDRLYNGILAHMEEVSKSAFYRNYASHTVPQGKLDNYLVANLKKMLIGAAVGFVIACGLWFLAALAPEFRRNQKDDKDGKRPGGKDITDRKGAAEA